MIVAGIFFLSILNSPGLADLERQYSAASKAQPFDVAKLLTINDAIMDLAEHDQIVSGDEYLRAEKIITDFRFRLEVSRERHELCLAALASGNVKAREEIKKTWDGFILATGREQRVGTIRWNNDPRFNAKPTAKSILNVFLHPDNIDKLAKSNPEVTKICADDQDVRKDWSKLTAKQMMEMGVQDAKRKDRIIKILRDGKVITPEDFDHASLVMQHGTCWEDYCLAHELAICSLIMGNQDSAWLAAATYDRMLRSAGYDQRFGTQYSSDGTGPTNFDQTDTHGLGDAMRKAMHCPTLEQAKNRKWD